MKKKTAPLVCYARARNQEEAQQCAWDVCYAPDCPEDAEPYPSDDDRKMQIYEVTITARLVKKGKRRG